MQKIAQQQTTKGKGKAQALVKSQAYMHKPDSYSIPPQPLTEADSTMLAEQPIKQNPAKQ